MVRKVYRILPILFLVITFLTLLGCTQPDTFILKKQTIIDGNVEGLPGGVSFICDDGNYLCTQSGFDFNSDTNTLYSPFFVGDGSGLTNLPQPDLNDYAKLDGTNQPFTGKIDINNNHPELDFTNSFGQTTFKKLDDDVFAVESDMFTVGGIGNGVNLSTTKYGVVPSVPMSGTYSIAFWINRSTATGTMISHGFVVPTTNRWRLVSTSSNTFRLNTNNSAGTGVNSPTFTSTLNTWEHYVITYNGTALAVYRNGVSTPVTTINTAFTSFTKDLSIGADPDGTNSLGGLFDELIVYDRVLSTAEIATLYDSNAPTYRPITSGQIIGLAFDQITGSTTTNYSGSDYNMTFYGTPSFEGGIVPTPSFYSRGNLFNIRRSTLPLVRGEIVFGTPETTSVFEAFKTFFISSVSNNFIGNTFFDGITDFNGDSTFRGNANVFGELIVSDVAYVQPVNDKGQFLARYTGTATRTLLYNNFLRTVVGTGEQSVYGLRNVLSVTANDSQTSTFTGTGLYGMINQIVYSGTHSPNPTVFDRVNLYGTDSVITDQSIFNSAGKTRSMNIIGSRNRITLNNASLTAGTLTKNLIGNQVDIGTQVNTNYVTNAYGFHLLTMYFSPATTVTGNVLGYYGEPDVNNIMNGKLRIGDKNLPTVTLDVAGKGTFSSDLNVYGTLYYNVLEAMSPHALMENPDVGYTQICKRAVNGKVVIEEVRLISGVYQNVIVEDTTGLCNKVVLKDIVKKEEEMIVNGVPQLVVTHEKVYESIWDKVRHTEIENYFESLASWDINTQYYIGNTFVWNGVYYEVIQDHVSQEDWLPNLVPALYKVKILHEFNQITAWVQPQGAHDCYPLGAIVTYQGKTYESTHNCNVWAPPTLWKLV